MQFACLTTRVIAGPSGPRNSIAQNWYDFLKTWALMPIILPSSVPEATNIFLKINPSLLILTGGNDICPLPGEEWKADDSDSDKHRDIVEYALIKQAIKSQTPILGVCRGMQILNVFLGGKLTREVGSSGRINHAGEPHMIFPAFTRRQTKTLGRDIITNSFHKHGLYNEDMSSELVVQACSEDGLVEAFKHSQLPIIGIQWHPERPGSCHTFDNILMNELMDSE